MNRGLRTPLSTPTHLSERVPAHRRRWVLLAIASFAACAWTSPAFGATVSINASAASTVLEGDTGTTPASFVVSLGGTEVVGEVYTVDFATANIPGEAIGGVDYTIVNGSSPPCGPAWCVTFGPLDYGDKQVTVDVIGDNVDENNETFLANITNPTGGATINLAADQATATITDDDTAVASITNLTPSFAEGTAPPPTTAASFTVTLSNPSDRAVTVRFHTASGGATPATAGTDYTAVNLPGTIVTFPAGDQSQPFTINITADNIDENNETFLANITDPTGGATINLAADQATATITDDDTKLTLSGPAPAITEGTGPGVTLATFTITATNAPAAPIDVAYSTNAPGGTGFADPADLVAPLSGIVTLAANTTVQTFSLEIARDNIEEASETFSTSIVKSGGSDTVTIVGSPASATIANDDLPPTISIAGLTVSENPTLPLPTVARELRVTLSHPSAIRTITVSYSTAPGVGTTGATAADYSVAPPSGPLTFGPLVTTQTIPVTIIDDLLDENDETFSATLANPAFTPVTPPLQPVTIADGAAVATILDDDAPPSVSFAFTSAPPPPAQIVVLTNEAPVVTTFASLTVQLSQVSGLDVTVGYATADLGIPNGAATQNVDYFPISSTLTIPAGQRSRTFSIPILGDSIPEGTEAFQVSLSAPVNAIVADPALALVDILNFGVTDQQPPFPNLDTFSTPRNVTAKIDVLANDTDPNNDFLFVSGNTDGAHGTASCTLRGICTYAPTRGFAGRDSFTYVLNDAQATATGTVNITVVNATPIANPDVLVTGQGAPGSVNVLTNDTDPDGGTLSVASAANGAHGTVACGAGTCNYVPAGGFIGADQFTYTLKDNDGATAVGTVSVTVAKGKPLTITASANGAKSRKGAKNGYTITIRNPNPGPVTLTSVSVCIPKGFSYTAGSVAGPLKKIPAKGACGTGKAKLTWAKKVSVPANRFVTLRFKVNVGGALTTAKVTVTAKAADGFAVISLTKPAAPIKVTAPLSHGAK